MYGNIFYFQPVIVVVSDLLEELHHMKDVLKYARVRLGELFVMISGMSMMLT